MLLKTLALLLNVAPLFADVLDEQEELAIEYSLTPVFEYSSTPAPEYEAKVSNTPSSGCECAFPQGMGLVEITPHFANAGWAMSENQRCSCNSWCPYACPAGYQSLQWNPDADATRMDGGFWCNSEGSLEIHRPEASTCGDFRGEIYLRNSGSSDAYACQTVFPGNEDMRIPNYLPVGEPVQIAIPNSEAYHVPGYAEAAGAHYFVNQHGIHSDTACAWGNADEGPYGNWAPYVIGTNRGSDGLVYLSLGWNPVYLEYASSWRDQNPKFGMRINCDGCANAECGIDPRQCEVNQMLGVVAPGGKPHPNGRGPHGTFCVASVPVGTYAEVEIFEV